MTAKPTNGICWNARRTHRRPPVLAALAAALLLTGAERSAAWDYAGHRVVVPLSLDLVHRRLPIPFTAGAAVISQCSGDPDAFKDLSPDLLKPVEGPEHFINLEYFAGDRLPARRGEYPAFCARHGVNLAEAGYLPYAIQEWTERLRVSFAEYRRWPEDLGVRSKCLVYAGILAHYAADLCQPLHLTADYDGRRGRDGKSPHSGIHLKVDALLGKTYFPVNEVLDGLRARPVTNVMERIAGIAYDRAPIDRVYSLESHLAAVDAPAGDDPAVRAFARDRLRAATLLTADLFLTAWEDSQTVTFPAWFDSAHTGTKPAAPTLQGKP